MTDTQFITCFPQAFREDQTDYYNYLSQDLPLGPVTRASAPHGRRITGTDVPWIPEVGMTVGTGSGSGPAIRMTRSVANKRRIITQKTIPKTSSFCFRDRAGRGTAPVFSQKAQALRSIGISRPHFGQRRTASCRSASGSLAGT